MHAVVLASGKERLLGRPAIPDTDDYVMFDLEGLPHYLDDLEKVYLWGMQAFGKSPGGLHGRDGGLRSG